MSILRSTPSTLNLKNRLFAQIELQEPIERDGSQKAI